MILKHHVQVFFFFSLIFSGLTVCRQRHALTLSRCSALGYWSSAKFKLNFLKNFQTYRHLYTSAIWTFPFCRSELISECSFGSNLFFVLYLSFHIHLRLQKATKQKSFPSVPGCHLVCLYSKRYLAQALSLVFPHRCHTTWRLAFQT